MLNKKGVVTTFIILGILIVGLVIGTYFTKDYILKSQFERLREQPIPEQAKDVRTFVESCVKQVGEEAVRKVGMQAGFVDIPGDPIELSRVNIFSNGLVVGGSLKVPYWLYEQANGISKEQMPSLDNIGKEISKYIDNNLKTCLNNFEDFKDYKINSGIIKTETEIQTNAILFTVNYPVHIELKDFKFDFTGFYETIDAPLGELYDIAQNIYYEEKNNMFLEENTIDWMGQYSDEIPTSGVKQTCVPPFWVENKVITDFKDILFNNVQFFKLKGSNYVLTDMDNERFVIDIGSVNNIDANFMFSKSWPFELEVVPEENGLLKAQSITQGLGSVRGLAESFICMSTWHFVYNVKYPVLITLSKDDYVFQFALQVKIDRNEPRQSKIVTESIPEMDKKFCENKQNKISVYTIDENDKPLEGVDIEYKCITHTCSVGTTKLDIYGDASLTERFPICINGAVIGNKEGYNSARESYSSTTEGALTLQLEQFKNLNVGVSVQRGGSGEVKENENVLISLEESEKKYGVFVNYPDQKEIKLVPGTYKVKILMTSDYPEEITIPEKTVQQCVKVPTKTISGLLGRTTDKCVDIKYPSMKLDQVITGNVEFDLSISKENLRNNKIVFYVPYSKPTSFNEYVSTIKPSEEFIKPKFENV